MTVASARNGAYGDSVARLLTFAGHAVEEEYYYNDAGTQIGPIPSVRRGARRRGEEPPDDGYRGDYLHELAALIDGDPVPHMLARIEATLERFRIHIDGWAQPEQIVNEVSRRSSQPADLRERRRRLRPLDGLRGRQGPRPGLARARRHADVRAAATSPICATSSLGFDRGIYVLGADHHGTCAGGTRPSSMVGVRALARRGAHLPARPPDRARRG